MTRVALGFLLILTLSLTACNQKKADTQTAQVNTATVTQQATLSNKASKNSPDMQVNHQSESVIKFIELGSVNCIPCKKMQPVMKSIEENYAGQVEVVFYDVWQADQRKYAKQYGIRLIPTQVFLNQDGKEIFRHEGFFPEAEIDQFLQKQGLTPDMESQKG